LSKKLFVVLFLFSLSVCCFASGEKELGKSDLKTLTDNIIKWKSHDITSYSCKVVWSASNKPETLLELKVVDKKVVSCIRDDYAISEFSGVQKYTVDELHSSAKEYVRKNKRNASMLYVIQYDQKYGYITSFARIYNPKSKADIDVADYNYRIKVYDFVPGIKADE